MEVCEAVLALHIFTDELEFTEGHLIVLQVSQAHLVHTSLKTIGSNPWLIATKIIASIQNLVQYYNILMNCDSMLNVKIIRIPLNSRTVSPTSINKLDS